MEPSRLSPFVNAAKPYGIQPHHISAASSSFSIFTIKASALGAQTSTAYCRSPFVRCGGPRYAARTRFASGSRLLLNKRKLRLPHGAVRVSTLKSFPSRAEQEAALLLDSAHLTWRAYRVRAGDLMGLITEDPIAPPPQAQPRRFRALGRH
jgi:hypothetical protein